MWPVILLIEVGATFFDLSYGDGFTSLNIFAPQGWVSALIEPDNNYAEDVNNLNIYFSLEDDKIDISEYVVTFTHPDADSVETCDSVSRGDVDGDWVAVCSAGVSTEGSYGPISLVIRESANSQIYAENVAFGYFALLAGSETTDGALTVSFYSTGASPVYKVESSVTLKFSFTLDVDMYWGDFFMITCDSDFDFEDLELEWDTEVDDSENFNDTMTELYVEYIINDHGNDDPKDDTISSTRIYIYGFTGEVTDGASVSFRLKGFTAPTATQAADSSSWSLDVQRFGTYTLRKRYTGTGPSDAVTAGAITVVSWLPVNSAIATSLLKTGLTTWFKLVVKTEHKIPSGGVLGFAFTNNALCSKTWISNANQVIQSASSNCGLWTDSSDLTCTNTDATHQSCSASADISAGTSIAIYNLITLDGALTVSSVTLKKTSGGATIDEYTTGFPAISLQSSGVSDLTVNHAKIASKADTTAISEINKSGLTYGFLLDWTASGAVVSSGSSLNVYFPFTTGSAADNTKLVFKSTTSWAYRASNLASGYTYTTDLVTGTPPSQTLGTNRITLAFTDVADTKKYAALVGSGTHGVDSLFLPKIPTQMSQMAEIVVILETSSTKFIYVSPLYFSKSTFDLGAALHLACLDASVAGMPASVSYTPEAYTISSDYSIRVDFAIAGVNFLTGAGLTAGDTYASSTFKVNSAGNLYISAGTSLAATAATQTIPLPAKSAGNLILTVSISLVKTGSDDIEIYTDTATTRTTVNSNTGTYVSFTDADVTGNVGVTKDLNIDIITGYSDGSGSGTETISVIYVLLFPHGVSTSDDTLSAYLSPPNDYFPYSYGYGVIDNYVEGSGSADRVITVTIPWFEKTSSVKLYAAIGSFSSGFGDLTCDVDSIDVISQNALFLTPVSNSYSPTTAKGFTYANQNVDVSFSLTSSKKILKGTTIVATPDNWDDCDDTVYSIGGTVIETFPTTVEYAANSVIKIQLSNCALPELSSSSTVTGFTSVSGTYGGNEYLFWTEAGTTTQTVISANTAITGKVSNAKMWVFPDVVGSTGVYFGIDFTFDAAIPLVPSGSTIAIAGTFTTNADASEDTWCNFAFSSSVASSNTLTITTAEELPNKFSLSCVVDLAFDLTTATPDAVVVTVTEPGLKILIADTSTTQKYKVYAAPESEVVFTVTPSNLNAGFSSVHEFNVTFDTETSDLFYVYLDNNEYNAEAGMTFEFEDEPGVYFLLALDSDGVFVPCFTVHWVITCVIFGSYDAGETLSVNILLNNPPETGSWGVYVSNDTETIGFKPEYLETDLAFKNDLENDIDLYFADIDFGDNDDHLIHEVVLNALVTIDAAIGSTFLVNFPQFYDFEEYPFETIPCALEYHKLNADNVIEPVSLLPEDTECEVSGNMVSFTLEAAQTFTGDFWTTFYVSDVITPEYGFLPSREYIYENSEYELYTGVFCIFYGNDEDGFKSASFDNLNAAFAGFDGSDFEALVVNDGNNILATPGTWSGPYLITNAEGRLLVAQISVSGSTEDNDISISLDEDAYYLDYRYPWAEFYVGVESAPDGEKIEEGWYVIVWSVEEQTPFGNGKDVYCRPRNTIVEVSYNQVFSVVLNPPDIFVPLSGWSMPINLEIAKGEGREIDSLPYDSIEIAFEDDEGKGLLYRPNPLVLDYASPAGFVSIQCTGCNETQVYPIGVSVEGTDAAAFKMAKDKYTFTSGSRYSVDEIAELVIDSQNPTSFAVSLKTDQIGLATLAVIGYDAFIKDPEQIEYEYILNNSFILGEDSRENNNRPGLDELKNDHEERMKQIDEEAKDYREQTKLKLNAGRNVYYPAQVMVLGTGVYPLGLFDKLVPNSVYLVVVYFDNFDGGIPTKYDFNVTTGKTPAHAKVGVVFKGDVPTEASFTATLVKYLQLPETNLNLEGAHFGSRRLQDNTVYVYSDISSDTSAADTVSDNQNDIQSDTNSELTVTELNEDDYEDGAFEGEVTWGLDNGIYVTLNYTAAVAGSLVCTVEANGTTLTSNQVYEGVNADGDDVVQYVEDIAAEEKYWIYNFTGEGYTVYGTYHVSCIVCNDYPGTPSCSDVEETDYEYTGEEDNSSGAEALVVAFAAYFLF